MKHFLAYLLERDTLIAQFAKTCEFFPPIGERGWYITHLRNYRLSTGQLEALQESLEIEYSAWEEDKKLFDEALSNFLAGLNSQEAPPEALSGTNEKEEK